MVFTERKKNQVQPRRHRPIRIIAGGDIGAVVAWGGAMAVAGLVAGFAISRRFARTKNPAAAKKKKTVKEEEVIKKTEMDSCDLVSAILGEKKPKGARDDGANAHPENVARVINYSIPAPLNIVDPYNTVNPGIEEIIPFNKLKPEFIAGIVEECKSLAIDRVDPPVPLKEGKVPVILKPILSQVTLEAEPLLSPIKEVEEQEDEDEEKVEYNAGQGDEESIGAVQEAIWPAEILEELSRELKAMKINLERPQEVDMVARTIKTSKGEECNSGAMPSALAQTANLSRSRARLWLSMSLMFLLVLLIFRFDAMSCVFDTSDRFFV